MFRLLPLSCCCLTFCKCLGSGSGTKNRIIFTLLIYLAAEGRIIEVETLQKGNESENENTSGQCDKSHGNICFLFCLCLGVVFAFMAFKMLQRNLIFVRNTNSVIWEPHLLQVKISRMRYKKRFCVLRVSCKRKAEVAFKTDISEFPFFINCKIISLSSYFHNIWWHQG